MTRRITVMCDNSVGPMSGTLGEHGFAALIEREQESILFDTGQGATILHNAARLNRDLGKVRRVALSHGHYDHTGGLKPLLEQTGPKEVFAHPGVFARRFRFKDTGDSTSIGIPHSREELEHLGASFNLSADFREVCDGVYLTGAVPRTSGFEHGDSGLSCDENGCQPDLIPDDQSLVIDGGRGLVLVLGCCHAGIVNTLEYVIHKLKKEVYAVIGGTHLGFCSGVQLEETVRRLQSFGIKKICGSHCTGFSASATLAREFPGHYHPAQVGFALET